MKWNKDGLVLDEMAMLHFTAHAAQLILIRSIFRREGRLELPAVCVTGRRISRVGACCLGSLRRSTECYPPVGAPAPDLFFWSKVRYRFLNLFDCVISVSKLVNRSFMSLNLFGCVVPIPKLINHLFRSPNLSSRVILVPKFDFESHLNSNRTI